MALTSSMVWRTSRYGSLERIARSLQVGRPGEVADAVRIQASRRRRIEPSVAIEQLVFLRPDRGELRDLLVLRHAREQIFHALFDGCRGVAIDGPLLRVRGGGGEECATEPVAHAATAGAGKFFIVAFPLPRNAAHAHSYSAD